MDSTTTTAIDRDWIASAFLKVLSSERSLVSEMKARAASPPDPALGVLYHEIAAADERHVAIIETIATRYGHTPIRSEGGGVAETLGRLKDKVTHLASSPSDLLGQDLLTKADAIHWETAWVRVFESVGDAESARDLTAALTEDQAHRDALLDGLTRMTELSARGAGKS